MGPIIMMFMLVFVIGMAVGGGIAGWIGFNLGKEKEAQRWKPREEWKKKEVTNFE